MRARIIFTMLVGSMLSSCGHRHSLVELSGYALVFKNRPIILYTSARKESAVEIDLASGLAPLSTTKALEPSTECIAHIYKLKVRGRLSSAKRMDAVSAHVASLVDATELRSFLSSVQSPVLNVHSVCPTA